MKYSYQTCTSWLREKTARLITLGFKVETKENAVPIQSFLLKISSSTIEAELVVWETGATSMIVFNLSRNGYDLDRHDIVLVGEHFESELAVFFKLLK